MSNETVLVPEGIFTDIKDKIFRTVLFSQKQNIKQMVLVIVQRTKDYTEEFVESNWDAIFEQLAWLLKLTAVPGDDVTGGEPGYRCAFDPDNAVATPESEPQSIVAVIQFVAWILPYFAMLFK